MNVNNSNKSNGPEENHLLEDAAPVLQKEDKTDDVAFVNNIEEADSKPSSSNTTTALEVASSGRDVSVTEDLEEQRFPISLDHDVPPAATEIKETERPRLSLDLDEDEPVGSAGETGPVLLGEPMFLPMPRFSRGRILLSQPGAVSIPGVDADADADSVQSENAGYSHNQQVDNQADGNLGTIATNHDYLVSATLVGDQPIQPLVQAYPALQGFRAILANTRFKYLAAIFVFVLLAIVIPSALLASKAGGGFSLLECGTQRLKQADYRGQMAMTDTGKKCQPWASQIPHRHDYDPESYPSAGLDGNFCRNPNGGSKTWCYTTDPDARFAYCDIPYCDGEELVTNENCGTVALEYADYRGNVSVTATGKTCQRWDSQYPHSHGNAPENRPSQGIAENFCRTAEGWPTPWCYTADPATRWEFCDVPICGEDATSERSEVCNDCIPTLECGSAKSKQQDYIGTINVTASGLTCQAWGSQTPHRHDQDPQYRPNKNLEENYCRNADNANRAWCYTTDPEIRSEFCDIPYCPDSFVPRRQCGTAAQFQSDYRGGIAVTAIGKECIGWEEGSKGFAEGLRYSALDFPQEGLIGNFCRNPSGISSSRSRSWCYTADIDWEFCDVPACQDCGTISQNKSDYRGNVATTIDGKHCQKWADQYSFLSDSTISTDTNATDLSRDFFFAEWGLEGNLCRNPAGERDDVWCYVGGDHSSDWQYCDAPSCKAQALTKGRETCGSPGLQQTDYRGSVNMTQSGLKCQDWQSQEPQLHMFTTEDFPSAGLDNNFCRNHDGSQGGAWCYTTDPNVRREYCNVTACNDDNTLCGSATLEQSDYRGVINATISGEICQAWAQQTPHPHDFTPESWLEDGITENYCRNPGGISDRAWCFTMNPDLLWEECLVPVCD